MEHPNIAFIGLSNWKLDSAKMNRMTLHRVIPPNRMDLTDTAEKIVKEGSGSTYSHSIHSPLTGRISKIAAIYDDIMQGMQFHSNPETSYSFEFSFYGHRDYYSLVSYFNIYFISIN